VALVKSAIAGLCGVAALGTGLAAHHANPAPRAAVPRADRAAHAANRPSALGTVSAASMLSVSLTAASSTARPTRTPRALGGSLHALITASLDPSPMPLAQSLGTYFSADPATWQAPLTLGMSARYVAAGASDTIPIFLVAPTQMPPDYADWTTPNSFVGQIQSEVTIWLSDTAAPRTDASIEFTMTVGSAGEQPTHTITLRYGLG
jgi:hypothetical protein